MNLRNLLFAALIPAGMVLVHDFPEYDTAPNIAVTSLELTAGKPLTIASNAMHWRQDIFEMMKSGGTVQFFKPHAWYRKIGMAKVGEAMTLGGKAIGAGEYTVTIKVPAEDTSKYFLEWKSGSTAIDVPLALAGGGEVEDHLMLALTPRGGAGSKEFALKVAYGDLHGSIAGSFGAAKQ